MCNACQKLRIAVNFVKNRETFVRSAVRSWDLSRCRQACYHSLRPGIITRSVARCGLKLLTFSSCSWWRRDNDWSTDDANCIDTASGDKPGGKNQSKNTETPLLRIWLCRETSDSQALASLQYWLLQAVLNSGWNEERTMRDEKGKIHYIL